MSPEMNNKEQEEILNSLQGMKRAAAPEFFYTRLRARMEQELNHADTGWFARLLTRPALSIGLAAFIVLLNITTIMEMWNKNTSSKTDSAPIVVADYTIATYTVYDETPGEP